MDVLLVVVVAIGLLAGLAIPVLVIRALWRGLGDELDRFPPEARRRGQIAGALLAIYIVGGAALGIVAPWGPDSVLYVIAVGGGLGMLVMGVGVGVQARRDVLRARERRAQRLSG